MAEPSEKLATPAARAIERALNSISGGKALDICTDDGDFINTLKGMLNSFDSFVGIDISDKNFQSALKKFSQEPVSFLKMNAESLEFEDDSFDTVCISYSLHHLDAIPKVLSEMKRVLKPNGHFIIQEMYSDGHQSEAQTTDMLMHHWDAKVDSLFGIPHNATLAKQELKEEVAALGLKDFRVFDIPHPVKCLLCSNRAGCEDPKNENVINFAIKRIEKTLNRLQEHVAQEGTQILPDVEKLKEEGEKLKKRVQMTGAAEPSQLFFIGKK
ncbi:MAG: class I SAM-dependent methyltransferase [Candidatus Thorarchaeota archaeon]